MKIKIDISFFTCIIFFSSCSIQMEFDTGKENIKAISNKLEIILESKNETTYKGCWVYGEGQHIFKDETTLAEYNLEFPNENMKELRKLYLAVCEMEYFPLECAMTGHIKKYVLANQETLVVSDFEILYIQGCGE